MTKPIERRAQRPGSGERQAPFALRSNDTEPNDGWTLDGYGAVFNCFTVIDSWEGVFREQIANGSMKKSFRENPPIIQYDHGRHPMIGSMPIASVSSVAEESDPELAPAGGAHIVGRMNPNWLIEPLRDCLANGQINGMSFRFSVVREKWETADGKTIKDDQELLNELRRTWDGTVPDDELPIRTLQELRVPEMGPVCWPAYTETSAGVRSINLDELGTDPDQRAALARKLFAVPDLGAVHAPKITRNHRINGIPGRTGILLDKLVRAESDTDDDPAALAGAVDAALDQAADLIEGKDLSELAPDVAQALNLLIAAGVSADALLEAMGIDDPDDDDDAGETDSAAPPGSVRKDVDAPQPTTRQNAGVAGEHPSRKIEDAPQPTTRQDAGVAGEHSSTPQKPRQRLSATEVAKEMARTRNVLLSIPK